MAARILRPELDRFLEMWQSLLVTFRGQQRCTQVLLAKEIIFVTSTVCDQRSTAVRQYRS